MDERLVQAITNGELIQVRPGWITETLYVDNHDCPVKCGLVRTYGTSPLTRAILLACTYPDLTHGIIASTKTATPD